MADTIDNIDFEKLGFLRNIADDPCLQLYAYNQVDPDDKNKTKCIFIIKKIVEIQNLEITNYAEYHNVQLLNSFYKNSPHFPIVRSLRPENGKMSIYSEYIEGCDLFDYIWDEEPPYKKKMLIFIKLLKIVKKFHNLGIIHHDLKLDNIIINDFNNSKDGDKINIVDDYSSDDFNLSVIDWEYSYKIQYEDAANDVTEFNCEYVRGTLEYLAPELFTKYKFGKFTDIWCLGVILFGLMTRIEPFGNYKKNDDDENNQLLILEKIKNIDYDINYINIHIRKDIKHILSKIFVDYKKRITIDDLIDLVENIDTDKWE